MCTHSCTTYTTLNAIYEPKPQLDRPPPQSVKNLFYRSIDRSIDAPAAAAPSTNAFMRGVDCMVLDLLLHVVAPPGRTDIAANINELPSTVAAFVRRGCTCSMSADRQKAITDRDFHPRTE